MKKIAQNVEKYIAPPFFPQILGLPLCIWSIAPHVNKMVLLETFRCMLSMGMPFSEGVLATKWNQTTLLETHHISWSWLPAI